MSKHPLPWYFKTGTLNSGKTVTDLHDATGELITVIFDDEPAAFIVALTEVVLETKAMLATTEMQAFLKGADAVKAKIAALEALQ